MRFFRLASSGEVIHWVTTPALVRAWARLGICVIGALGLWTADASGVGKPQAPARGLTLDRVIQLCLMRDPRIRSGLELVQQARADARTSSLRPNPELSVGKSFMPLNRPFTPDEPGGPPELAAGLSYPVDWFLFGKRTAAFASAGAGIGVSEAEYADLVRKRVTEAAVAFHDVLEAQALLEVARQDTENLARVELLTQKAVENGARAQVELNRVRLELLNTRRGERDAHAALVRAKAVLQAFLGEQRPSGGLELSGSLEGPLTSKPPGVEEALAAAIENRPDLQALRARIVKARRDVVLERRKARPEVTPEIEVARQYQRAIGAPDADGWSAAIAVTLPISDRTSVWGPMPVTLCSSPRRESFTLAGPTTRSSRLPPASSG